MKLYDVIKKEKGSLDIPSPQTVIIYDEPYRELESEPKPLWKKYSIVATAGVLLALLYVLGIKMVRTKVVIIENKIPFSLSEEPFEFVYDKDATSGRLSFQTMVVSGEVTREVYGAEVVPSTTSAKGSVVFFNDYTTTSKTIKSGTILTATNGKKYKTQETVSVPGYTIAGKVKNPGTSTPVAIIASDTGSSYNSTGTSLSVTGWTSKQIYAQTVGAITGGEVGVAHVVSDADEPGVVATLQAQLAERLKRESRAQIPDTLIAFPELQFLSIDGEQTVLKGSDIRFPAKMRGTMVTYLIPRDLLETAIATRTLSADTFSSVYIPSIDDLVVSPTTAIPSKSTTIPQTITVKLTGSGTVVTQVPTDKVLDMLVGMKKSSFASFVNQVPEIQSARVTMFPFWSPFFPAKKERITLLVR